MTGSRITRSRNFFGLEFDVNRVYGLDILRAMAIIFVMISHGQNLLPPGVKGVHDIIRSDGVSIFFVLSGFLIGGILIKLIEKKGLDRRILMSFWIRRWFRTIPNYILVLSTLILLTYFHHPEWLNIDIWRYFLFIQNFNSPHPIFFAEAWSLSVEEWFYLFIPIALLVLTLIRIPPRSSFLMIAVLVILAATYVRADRFAEVIVNSRLDFDDLFRKQVITRLDSLMYGVIGAYLNFYHQSSWTKYPRILFFFGLMIFAFNKMLYLFQADLFNSMYVCVFSFSTTSIATLLFLPLLSGLKKGSGILFLCFTCISLISYSMYLLNLSIVRAYVLPLIPWFEIFDREVAYILRYLFFWGATISLSILLYKYFELPMTRLRERFDRLERMPANAPPISQGVP